MNTEPQDSLDRLLGDWAASRQADDEATRRLADQILAAVREQPDVADAEVGLIKSARLRHEQDVVTPAEQRPAFFRPTADWTATLMIGGGGLLLLLILVGGLLYDNLAIVPSGVESEARSITVANGGSSVPPIAVNELPAAASVGEDVLAAKRRLLTETNDLFDNQLAWIADGEREVQLDVHDQPVQEDGEFVLVRVVVARRAAPDAPWSTVWQTDVISRNETLVELAPQQLDGSSLQLWTYAMADGEVAVEMDLTLERESPMHSSSSAVLQAGRPARVSCSTEQGGEQCVFQTVMPLHPSQI